MLLFFLRTIVLVCLYSGVYAQISRIEIGTQSSPANTEISLSLKHRFQHFNATPKNKEDNFDTSIDSPKSAIFLPDNSKMYVHSLEGMRTTVYDVKTMKKMKVITHNFTKSDAHLFLNGEYTLFDYQYRNKTSDHNIFGGKPVESCLSHNGRYLWVTYYRRSYDANAESPSALAIIDTQKDEIVRVMPTGSLPKMIACSADNKTIAVTHWGDNTVALIDISGNSYNDFKYTHHLVVEKKLNLDFGAKKVNRDAECGFCLRGTVFTPDNKYLLVGRMGGGGIAFFDMATKKYIGTVHGMYSGVRHLVIKNGELLISTNTSGYVQKTNLEALIKAKKDAGDANVTYKNWSNCMVGTGARTIECSADGKYIFAAVNNACKVVVVRSSDMQVVCSIKADAYPVGLAVSKDGQYVVVTAQGKSNGGGNSVMVFKTETK